MSVEPLADLPCLLGPLPRATGRQPLQGTSLQRKRDDANCVRHALQHRVVCVQTGGGGGRRGLPFGLAPPRRAWQGGWRWSRAQGHGPPSCRPSDVGDRLRGTCPVPCRPCSLGALGGGAMPPSWPCQPRGALPHRPPRQTPARPPSPSPTAPHAARGMTGAVHT